MLFGLQKNKKNTQFHEFILQVEVESLRKELAEKQELLSQAAKAFELIDEQKKMLSKEQSVYQKTLDEEREKIKLLESGKCGLTKWFEKVYSVCQKSKK